MQKRTREIRSRGQSIAFVPTMGFLHDGHLSLMAEGRRRADCLIASIFVNPTQFGPGEDYDRYPKSLEKDIELTREVGVDILFTPAKDDLYPDGFDTYLTQNHLPNHLCGLSRPGHFQGVLTIVAKLFNIVGPDFAVFGEKDFQQLAVIRRMTRDLNFDIEIVGHPIVRESDGLAMSSRNTYLNASQRRSALTLSESLKTARQLVHEGEIHADKIIETARAIIDAANETEIDYIHICDPDTLNDVDAIERPALMALAVKVGATRLIDNMILTPFSEAE